MRRSVVAALALVGTAACSYVFELPATEKSPTLPNAAHGDSGVVDGAADAPPPFVAPPPPPFCETHAAGSLYCNDFDDEPAPALTAIGTVEASDGGQLVLSSAVSSSPPRSVLVSVSGTSSSAAITHALGMDPDGLTLSFDLLVSAWGTTEGHLSQIELGDAQAQCVIGLEGTASTWSITQVCSAAGVEVRNVVTPGAAPIVRGRWQRFALKVTFAPTKAVMLDIDGVRAVDAPGATELKRAPASFTLGAKLVPSGSATLFLDNVLVTSP